MVLSWEDIITNIQTDMDTYKKILMANKMPIVNEITDNNPDYKAKFRAILYNKIRNKSSLLSNEQLEQEVISALEKMTQYD